MSLWWGFALIVCGLAYMGAVVLKEYLDDRAVAAESSPARDAETVELFQRINRETAEDDAEYGALVGAAVPAPLAMGLDRTRLRKVRRMPAGGR